MKRIICDICEKPIEGEVVNISVKEGKKQSSFDTHPDCYKTCPFHPGVERGKEAPEPIKQPVIAPEQSLFPARTRPNLPVIETQSREGNAFKVAAPAPATGMSVAILPRDSDIEQPTHDANAFPVAPPAGTGVTVSPPMHHTSGQEVTRYQTTNENVLADDFEKSE